MIHQIRMDEDNGQTFNFNVKQSCSFYSDVMSFVLLILRCNPTAQHAG